MTEDDTFFKLRKVPVQDVVDLYTVWWQQNAGEWTEEGADGFLKPHGWKFDEMYITINGMSYFEERRGNDRG